MMPAIQREMAELRSQNARLSADLDSMAEHANALSEKYRAECEQLRAALEPDDGLILRAAAFARAQGQVGSVCGPLYANFVLDELDRRRVALKLSS
jgi:hypothetical protein